MRLWRLLEAKNTNLNAHHGTLTQRSAHPKVPVCLPKTKAMKLFRGLKVSQSKTKNIESVSLAIYSPA